MSTQIVKVPDVGGDDVDVIEVCVAVGDQVKVEDSLLVLESDKASMEVPSPYAGKVLSIAIAVGDKASEGTVILELETESTAETEIVAEPAAKVEPVAVASVAEPVATATVSSVTATTEQTIYVPDVGGADAVDVIEVCIKVGDEVQEGDSLIVLETDKASMEVPSPYSGKVLSIAIKEGDVVSQGVAILVLESQASAAVSPASPPSTPVVSDPAIAPAPVVKAPAVTTIVESGSSGEFYAGPAVRKLVREFGVDGAKLVGSGPKGRVLKEDVQAYVKTQLAARPAVSVAVGAGIPAIPAIDFAKFGDISRQPLTKMDKLTAANMQRSWLNVPHVTQFDDADISDLEDFRASLKAEAEKRGVKLTPLPFMLKACALALKENPKFNTSLDADGEHLVYKNYIHIGMAVDTPAGLVVPVIRDVDKKSIWALAAETAEMAAKAKDRKLKPADMQGGCFTISSLGSIGGTGFTPIVNAPEVGILGVSKLAVKPVWNGSEFVPRKMLPLAVSYDHRVINGADAGRFFTYLVELLSDVRRLAL